MKSIVYAGLGVLCLLGMAVGSAEATTMDFTGGSGGLLTYDGGFGVMTGTSMAIGTVAVGASSTPVTGGLLNFITGNWNGSLLPPNPVVPPGAEWRAYFLQGVNPITITGGVAAAGIANGSSLLVGVFDLHEPTFTYFTGGTGQVEGLGLAISYINPALLTYFGLTGSSLSSADLALTVSNFWFASGTPTDGSPFTAGNDSSSLVATVATPEPASALLLGSGMIGVFAWGRKKLTKEMSSPLA